MSDEWRDESTESPAREPASELFGPASDADGARPLLGEGVPVYSANQLKRARDLLARVYALRKMAKFYPVSHPAVSEIVNDLYVVIASYHKEGVDVSLAFFEGEVFFGQQFLAEDSILFDQLIRSLSALGVGSLVFQSGLGVAELERAVPVFAAEEGDVTAAGGFDALLAAAGAPHIQVGRVTVLEQGDRRATDEDIELARHAYSGAVDVMRDLERAIRTNQTIGAGRVRGVVRSLVDNVLNNRYAMLELTGLKNYDEYTFYHSVNVAILSLALGSSILPDGRFLSSLGVGALLHDIGKLTVDLEILNKPGALSADEWAAVRMHPVYGAQTAAEIPALDRAAIVVILEHHMRYDLTGYPQAVTPRRQHIASRIVAVADAYDAMTSRRSYSAARMQDEAMELLAKNAGTALDPDLLPVFVGVMGVYPPRSAVMLTSGEIAVVLGPSVADPLLPRVRVLSDGEGNSLDPHDVDLSDTDAAGGRSIARCLDPEGLNIEVSDYM